MKKKLIFYPALLALYPVLFLFSRNMDETPPHSIWTPVVISLAVTALVWAGFQKWLKDIHRSAAATSLFIAIFFTFGHLHSKLHGLVLRKDFHVELGALGTIYVYDFAVRALLVAGMGFLALRALKRLRQPRDLASTSVILNTVAAVMVVMTLPPILTYKNEALAKADTVKAQPVKPMRPEESPVGYLPDVYFIIMDGYARADVLKSDYGFDNSEFLSGLEGLGFQHAPKSRSNFYWTYLSLSSALNFEYVNYLTEKVGIDRKTRDIPYEMIRDNKVARFLREKGYRIVHFNSTWGATFSNPYADESISCAKGVFQNEFYRVLAETTILRAFLGSVGTDLAQCHLHNFAELAKQSESKGPKFVFAHFLPPHHPYLFNREGKVIKQAIVSNQFDFQNNLWAQKDQYVDQLVFMNHKILETAQKLIQESENPPIILVMSDHGPHLFEGGKLLERQKRVSNFTAAYLPGNPKLIYDTITPVNLWRSVLNHYFKAGLEPLPDKSFFSAYHRPYKFKEIDVSTQP